MPIYAYKCADCGHAFDALQKISDAPLTECPQCHAQALHKQLTAAGFQLKGNGWYATDFSGKAPAAPPAAEGTSSAAAASPAPAAAPAAPAPAPAASPAPAAN
ncbi:FmdB family transcriptional regulator [Comamonas serinivorans]|uniref:FmdB family transcriptional regulator n=1 Tax=Comamonas serinivorans TaxID=1082851 RepID=A0A1Y0EPP5_9BURK|nr:FmdB family zinc ribbon protein [Comamonas serinivorans]ARU05603.1 FmdB family transcriptional regulator [Comamonas serinivorans]